MNMPKKDYSKEKITITIDKKLLKKINKTKKFPKWKNNRSAVIEAALEDFYNKNGKQ